MKKIVFILSLVIVIFLTFTACSTANTGYDKESGGGYAPDYESNTDALSLNVQERLIVYTAHFSLQCDDITETVKLLRSNLEAGEWFESEDIYSSSATFVARVKSDRLDEFIASVSEGGTVRDYRKTATDISLEYSDKKMEVDALTAECLRLEKLIENASYSETITINSRLSTLYKQIAQLTRSLNLDDSAVAYSTVTIYLTENYVAPVSEELNFGQRFVKVLKDSFNALGDFFQFILIALTAIFPFALFIVPAIILTFFLVRRRNKKINAQSDAEREKRHLAAQEYEHKIDTINNENK